MGPHTRFHLRIDAFGASNTSSMAGKGGGGAKASHLRRGGLASHQGFPKIGGGIAMVTKFKVFSFSIFFSKDGGVTYL